MDTRELWFIIVANPDGYDFTFDPPNRLWRKNLRDNNGDGQITGIDGVDPNRNFPTRWNYDDEGSNSNPDSETYRGTGPASEPETQAFISLMNRVNFAYNKNDHTAAKLILWPFGWQVDTHPADEPLMIALAGDDANPGIETFDPDVGADLYTTNGDTNDHMYKSTRTISFTPEGSQAATGSVFAFQDDEADVQAEFERHVQFALDLARSAPDPTHPVSHLTGFEPPNFVVDKFNVSYGSPQTVQVNARRDLGPIQAHWQVNGGATHTVNATEWNGGLRYGNEGDYWYHRMRAPGRRQRRGGRQREGLVLGPEREQGERIVHLQRPLELGSRRARPRRRGLHGAVGVPRVQPDEEAQLPELLHERAEPRTVSRTTCTTTTRCSARRRTRSEC